MGPLVLNPAILAATTTTTTTEAQATTTKPTTITTSTMSAAVATSITTTATTTSAADGDGVRHGPEGPTPSHPAANSTLDKAAAAVPTVPATTAARTCGGTPDPAACGRYSAVDCGDPLNGQKMRDGCPALCHSCNDRAMSTATVIATATATATATAIATATATADAAVPTSATANKQGAAAGSSGGAGVTIGVAAAAAVLVFTLAGVAFHFYRKSLNHATAGPHVHASPPVNQVGAVGRVTTNNPSFEPTQLRAPTAAATCVQHPQLETHPASCAIPGLRCERVCALLQLCAVGTADSFALLGPGCVHHAFDRGWGARLPLPLSCWPVHMPCLWCRYAEITPLAPDNRGTHGLALDGGVEALYVAPTPLAPATGVGGTGDEGQYEAVDEADANEGQYDTVDDALTFAAGGGRAVTTYADGTNSAA